MMVLGLSALQWDNVMRGMLYANFWLQVVCLFVVLPWLLVSKRRLRLRASDLPSVVEVGWAPFRDPRILRGSVAVILALLVQSLWVAALWTIDTAEKSACALPGAANDGTCGGMQWIGPALGLMLLAPGALAFSSAFHMTAMGFLRAAWDANGWPWKLNLRELPALTLVRILRYIPFAWYAAFLVGVLLAISPQQRILVFGLTVFLASFKIYELFKRNKRGQVDPQSDFVS